MSDSSVFKGAGQPYLPRGPKAAPAREKVGDVWRKESATAGVHMSPPAWLPFFYRALSKPPTVATRGAFRRPSKPDDERPPRSVFFSSGNELHPDQVLLQSCSSPPPVVCFPTTGLIKSTFNPRLRRPISQSSIGQRRARQGDTEEDI